ncbi:MAG: class I SAM-dependent methyltransferase, partial [Anaerolineales bacterium]
MRKPLYDIDAHIAEIYDQIMTTTADLAPIRRLIGARRGLRILEPFCGTGRLLLPLARDGHTVMGLDNAPAMLDRAAAKVAAQPEAVQARITLSQADVLQTAWPTGFDVALLGGNCLYELATPEEQAQVIAAAANALRPGGYLFVDNDHMEGELARAWYDPAFCKGVFPTGECADGARLVGSWRVIWYDAPRRLIRFERQMRITWPDGHVEERTYIQQKHPVSAHEVAGWLQDQGLVIE